MINRRGATRPHYRQSAERDHGWVLVITFVTGAMLGAVVAIGWMS
jgi:hypothetical protein